MFRLTVEAKCYQKVIYREVLEILLQFKGKLQTQNHGIFIHLTQIPRYFIQTQKTFTSGIESNHLPLFD